VADESIGVGGGIRQVAIAQSQAAADWQLKLPTPTAVMRAGSRVRIATQTNLFALDGLRGVLAVYVLIGHARWLLWAGHSAWLATSPTGVEWVLGYASAIFRFGHEAVMFFFVLSGFFIHFGYARARDRTVLREDALSQYYRRRVRRLVPTYAFALLITVALDAIGRLWWPDLYLANTTNAQLNESFAKKVYEVDSIIFSIFLLPSLGGKDFGSNGPLWSIANEVVYYALYPLWLRIRHLSPYLGYIALPLLLFLIALLPIPSPLAQLIGFYPVWLIGAAVSELVATDHFRSARMTGWMIAVGSLFAAIFLLAGQLHWIVYVIGLASLGGVTVYVVAQLPQRLNASFVVKFWAFLGLRSYSIYLVHFPLLALACAMLVQGGNDRPLHGWFAAGGIVVGVGFGVLCFQLCERFFLTNERVVRESAAPPSLRGAERT
jgi:peptidoglycan/LPS O-acetylase OafA/YrhL